MITVLDGTPFVVTATHKQTGERRLVKFSNGRYGLGFFSSYDLIQWDRAGAEWWANTAAGMMPEWRFSVEDHRNLNLGV